MEVVAVVVAVVAVAVMTIFFLLYIPLLPYGAPAVMAKQPIVLPMQSMA